MKRVYQSKNLFVYIKKAFFLLLIIHIVSSFLLSSKLYAQTYNGDYIITTQADVDAFNYTSVNGDLRISESISGSVLNLDGLSELTSVTGSVHITWTTALTNLNGLSSLTTITRNLQIVGNEALTDITGLSNLISVGTFLTILDNDVLTNLNGLSGITSTGEELAIAGNDALTDISGLSNMTSVGTFFNIEDNDALTHINGLTGLTTIGGYLRIANNDELTNVDGLVNLNYVGGNFILFINYNLTDFCGLYSLFNYGTIVGDIGITANAANTVSLTPLSDVILYNDAGSCSRVIADDGTIGVPVVYGCLVPGTPIHSDFPTGNIFPVGATNITWTVTDGAGNSATFTQTITVFDNEVPVITNCPSSKSVNTSPGVCYATATSVNAGTATASDNCSYEVVGTRSDGLALTSNYPVGITTIKWTATDASNNTATCSQTITVVDNVPPTITGESASLIVLSPSNHTMRDITINYTATDNCTVTSVITVTSNEPINGVGDGDTDPDWIITDNHHVKLRAERSANGTGRIYTITITATDPSANTSTKTVEVRVPHNIINPHSGQAFKVGSTVTFEGEFWDKAGNSHTAKWLIDENTTVKATVTEPSGNKNGKVTGSYKFTAPGVYKLQMNVTDQKGITNYSNTSGDLEAIVVIYDPNGGYAYGGGYYNSPVGALKSNLSATGKASYGFTLNYFKNSTYPKGETQFDFKVGSFEFNALNFEYLVINNSMSQFKGTGKITGGQSGVGFTMTVVDGQLDGSGFDKIRMKIYNRSSGAVIYDNQPGASDAALPTQAVGANSTIVISGTNSGLTQSNTTQKAEMEATAPEVLSELDVIAYPNPSASNFSISVKVNPVKEKITMQVVDMYGRVIETRNVNANSPIRFGDRYNAGTYFVRVIQGKQHKEIKLIKLSD